MERHEKIISNQDKYIRELKRNRVIINICRALGMILLLALWELAGRMEWIDTFIFSGPVKIVQCFFRMLKTQDLILHTWITLRETFLSFILMIGIGVLFAVILWRFERVAKILEPYFVVLNSLPKSALAPLLLVWLGANQRTIVVSGISVGVFGAIINLHAGFLKVDPEQIKLIETLGGNKRHVLRKVILPSTLPILISVMKVNIGLSLVGVVIGEFFAANKGLGYLIVYGSQVFKLDMVVMSIVILCILTILFYQVIQLLEKSILKIFAM